SRRRHTRFSRDWSSDVCSSDLVGLPAEAVAGFRQSPFWEAVEGVAHTIAYDGRFIAATMAGAPLDKDRWSSIGIPVLAMHGDGKIGRASCRGKCRARCTLPVEH